MKLKVLITLLLAMIFTRGEAWARNDSIPGSRYQSGRAAALGEAFHPLADDGAAGLFYQPAALAKLRGGFRFEPANLHVHMNEGYLNMIDKDFYQVFELNDWKHKTGAREGLFPGVGGGFMSTLFFKYFAAGVYYSADLMAQTIGSNVRYRSKYQFIPAAGLSFSLARGIVRVGYVLQWVHQASGDLTVDSSGTLAYNANLAQGSGFSHNIGYSLSLPVKFLPSINLVFRNVGGTSYGGSAFVPLAGTANGTPTTEEMSVEVAVSLQPKLGGGGHLNFIVLGRDLTNTSGFSLLKRLAAGLEITYKDLFFLRGGVSSLYPSGGVGLRRKRAEFSISYYSEEIGTADAPAQDVKVLLQYQFRAF